MRELKTISSGRTQADGPCIVDLSAVQGWAFHQVQVEVGKTPTAGDLLVLGRTPGANTDKLIGTIDMTGSDLTAVVSGVCFDRIVLNPVLFDSDKTFNVVVYSRP
jgi:hypothetical protein